MDLTGFTGLTGNPIFFLTWEINIHIPVYLVKVVIYT